MQDKFQKHQNMAGFTKGIKKTSLNSVQIMIDVSYVVCLLSFKRITAESLSLAGLKKKKKMQLEKLHVQSICLNCLLILTAHKCLMLLINHRKFLGCCYYPNSNVMFIITESMKIQIMLTWIKFNKMAQTKKMPLHI